MTRRARRQWWIAVAAASNAAFAGPAIAQADSIPFSIPEQNLEQALLRFAVRARVSINVEQTAQCRARSNAIDGVFSTDDALRRLLANTGCTFRVSANGAVVIERTQTRKASAPTISSDIVVTASRRPVSLSQAPFAVSALSGDEVNAVGIRSAGIEALTGRLAGVTVTNLGPGRNKIFLRGLSDGALSGRTQSTVGHYEDNLRITYDAPEPDLPLIDIARVEVLRGPQGTLYGGGSIGGVLHVVTNAPDPRALSSWVSAGYAAAAQGAPTRSGEGGVNIPLAPGAALRLVGWGDVQGGVISDAVLARRNVDRTERLGARATLRIEPFAQWSVTAGVTQQSINSDDSHYAQPALGRFSRALTSPEPHDNDFADAYVTVEGASDFARLVATTAVVRHEINSTYDASPAISTFAPGLTAPARFQESNVVELAVTETRLLSPEGAHINWLAGTFVSIGENTGHTRFDVGADPTSLVTTYAERRKDHITELALYGQIEAKLSERATLSAGARWFKATLSASSLIDRPLAATAAPYATRTSTSGLAPQITLSYAAGPRTTIYALASEGYRAGGVNTADGDRFAYAGPPSAAQPNRLFRPDELWNYEAGARLALIGGAMRLRVAAFTQRWADVQVDRLLPSGLSFTSNAGSARNGGVEFETTIPAKAFSFEAHGQWSSPELAKTDPSFPGAADTGLPGVPSASGGLGVTYSRAIGQDLHLTLNASVDYVGASRLTFDATTAPSMGNYVESALSATLRSRAWRLDASIENVGNGAGDTFAYGNPFSLRIAPQATPQRPRTFGLRLTRLY